MYPKAREVLEDDMANNEINEHLIFFKDLMEGRANTHFSTYLRKNEESLKKSLPRASFLRLKFEPVSEIRKILADHNIKFQENEAAVRKEEYLTNFHPDVLDESGELSLTHKNALFNGAIKEFHKGNRRSAKGNLYDYIGFPKKLSQKKNLERIKDVITFASIEGMHGDVELGKFLLKSLSQIGRQYSEVDDFVLQAADELKKIELT